MQKTYLNYENVKIENSALSVNNEIHFLYKVDANHSNKYGQAIIDVIPSYYKDHLIKHGIKKKHIVKEMINQISFLDLFKKHKINSFDLLYIDTEGYDCNLVNNFLEKIKIRPIIIFEWNHAPNIKLIPCLNSLISNSYFLLPIKYDLLCIPKEKNINILFN